MKKTAKQKRFERKHLYAYAFFDYSYQKNFAKRKLGSRFKMVNFLKTVRYIKRSMEDWHSAMISDGVSYNSKNKQYRIISSHN